MALLQMVNSVRGKLREERVGSISSTDLLTTEIIDLINDAGSEILEGDDWEFDVRHDGRLWFPASQSGTGGVFTSALLPNRYESANTPVISTLLDTAAGEVFNDVDLAGWRMSGNRIRSRVFNGNSIYPNTSWIITDVDRTTNQLDLTLGSNLNIDNDDPSGVWTTYGNEVVLPTTVKDVLSVRHEEEPIRLEFVNRSNQFDRWVPRSIDSFSTRPHLVMVGGTITSTSRTATVAWTTISVEAAVTGTGLAVWPIPSSDLQLGYSYRVQHADLVAATDTWTGVPQNVIRIIEWRAYQGALDSGIQNDPEAAQRAERQVEKRRLRAQMGQSRQPNRRRVPTEFGYGDRGSSRRRWSSQSISAPS